MMLLQNTVTAQPYYCTGKMMQNLVHAILRLLKLISSEIFMNI